MSSKKRSAASVDETAVPTNNDTVTLEKVENNLTRGPDFKALSAVEAFVSIYKSYYFIKLLYIYIYSYNYK